MHNVRQPHRKLVETVKIINDSESLGDALHEEYTRLRREAIEQTVVENEFDKEIYLKVLKRIKKEKYFSMEPFEELGLVADIYVFMTKKNSGKSHWMITKCNEVIRQGGEVVLVRVLDADVRNGLRNQCQENNADFFIRGNADFRLYHKEWKDPENPKKEKYCGIASGMASLAKWKGGSFPNVRAIFFDEITDDRKGKWCKEDVDVFFSHVLNSIERTKQIPLICFGNVDQNIGTENPVLASLGISSTTRFKYINRKIPGTKNSSRILYFNAGGMYTQGVQDSKFAGATIDVARSEALNKNAKMMLSSKVISEDLTPLATPSFACVFAENDRYLCTYATCDLVEGEEWWNVKVEPFNPIYAADFKGVKFTDSSVIFNQYAGILCWVESCGFIWEELNDAMLAGKCIICGGTEDNNRLATIVEERLRYYRTKKNPLKRKGKMY